MIRIQVPASTANLGPGFDSLGLALSMYNYFSFEEVPEGLEIVGAIETELDTENLVYVAMTETLKQIGYHPTGLKITLDTHIPISRGLGSSSTCIVAGVMGANELAGSPLSKEDIFKLATEIEGHPDNIAPALFGGLQASLKEATQLYHNELVVAPGLKFVALIPDFSLSTKSAREVLPERVSYGDAVDNISRVSLLLSALVNGRFELLKSSLKDNVHQPYRGPLIAGYDKVVRYIEQSDALGVYLSGAGPTIMAIVDENDIFLAHAIRKYLSSLGYHWEVVELHIEPEGARLL